MRSRIVADLATSRAHLEYSYKKVLKLDLSKEMSESELEVLESFSSRFARFSDIAVAKYFRFLALEKDPAFRGSVIDLFNLAEKYGWITSALEWKRIRELRNFAAHDYSMDDYRGLYAELIKLTPHLLGIKP